MNSARVPGKGICLQLGIFYDSVILCLAYTCWCCIGCWFETLLVSSAERAFLIQNSYKETEKLKEFIREQRGSLKYLCVFCFKGLFFFVCLFLFKFWLDNFHHRRFGSVQNLGMRILKYEWNAASFSVFDQDLNIFFCVQCFTRNKILEAGHSNGLIQTGKISLLKCTWYFTVHWAFQYSYSVQYFQCFCYCFTKTNCLFHRNIRLAEHRFRTGTAFFPKCT